ncbi:sugar ABC transporter substrate-binding protein [Spirochaetia bacterium]|nr:sugar ABC transporter substrate-binding protein [Spirochaetia bacterium]
MNAIRKIAVVLLMAVCVFSGCSKKDQGQAAANGGQVTIKVAVWDIAVITNYSELISEFEAGHPNIKVDVIDIPSADFTQKLSVMLNGGSAVDAFWIKDGDTTKGLASRGQLADLSAYIARDNVDLSAFNGLAERFNMDGKIVALPASSANYLLFYNRDIFDKAGIPYPSNDLTWPQFEALAGRLTSGTGSSKIWGAQFHFWQACVQNWAIQDGKHTIVETDYSFMKPYYEMVLRMQDAGVIRDYGSLRAANVGYANAFIRGDVAMLPMGFWLATSIKDLIERGETTINWGVAAIPHPEGVPAGWTVGSVTPIAINQSSKYKDAAWEFVRFVTSEEGAVIYSHSYNSPYV